MACAKAVWRGVTVCAHMVPKLNQWAKEVGDDIYLTPIQGCWANIVAASAGTHDYGAAIDIGVHRHANGNFYTTEQRRRVEKIGRKVFGMAYFRPANSIWTNHVHAGDPACPSKAATLAAQFPKYWEGKNALANNLADTGYRDSTWINADKVVFGKSKYAWFITASAKIATLLAQAVLKAPTYVAPVTINYNFPYQYSTGWYPYPGAFGKSYYGPSVSGNPWYSGRVAGGTNSGNRATSALTRWTIQTQIKRIQRLLGDSTPDGIYGPWTVERVKVWQKARGLTADGIVGPRTWAAMAKSKGQGK